jgi:UDP-glucose 4-epimerase
VEGHHVTIIDNLSTGRAENINRQADFYKNDIRDAGRMRQLFERVRPDAVIHQAAQMDVRKSVDDPIYDAEVNILGSLNLIRAACEFGCKRFVYASTGGAIYGDTPERPTPETHPPNPLSPYGVSKHTVEHYLHLWHELEGLQYVALRYGNVYGPRQSPHGEAGVVAIFVGQMLAGRSPTLYGHGTMTRDYVYVDDAVEANTLALTRGKAEVLNIGTGVERSVLDIFTAIKEHTGFTGEPILAERRKGEMQNSCLDPSLARDVLAWTPKVELAEGLRRTVEYWRGKA